MALMKLVVTAAFSCVLIALKEELLKGQNDVMPSIQIMTNSRGARSLNLVAIFMDDETTYYLDA